MLFLLPYLVLPIALSLVVRALGLERWRFMSYVLCATLLFTWPTLWEELRAVPETDPDRYVCGLMAMAKLLFHLFCAFVLVPMALGIQLLSNQILTRYRTS